jgi:hypothetical protein
MISNTVVFSNSSFLGSSPAGGTLTQWQGGRTAMVINATVYASGAVYLQMMCSDGVTLLNVGGPYGSNQIVNFDLPKGNYKIVNGQSSSLGVYTILASVPYA